MILCFLKDKPTELQGLFTVQISITRPDIEHIVGTLWRFFGSEKVNDIYIFWSLYKAAKLWRDCATSGWSGPKTDSRISKDRWKNDLAALLRNGEKITFWQQLVQPLLLQ